MKRNTDNLRLKPESLYFTGHAGFILSGKEKHVMVDPWIESRVFDNGWELLSPLDFDNGYFSMIDYIWFSHEHPDHFNLPSVKRIPELNKKSMTVLYQFTQDKKVKHYCLDQGFGDVVELAPNDLFHVDESLTLKCGKHTWGDSWALFDTSKGKILNVNDCDFSDESLVWELKTKVGKINVLMAQFSYAHGIYKKEDRQAEARKILNKLKVLCEVLQPDYVIPFASFVHFCHEENHYLNDEVNRIEDVCAFLTEYTDAHPVILYPGESWSIGEEHDNCSSIALYNKDYADVENKIRLVKSSIVDEASLRNKAKSFVFKLRSKPAYKMLNMVLYPPRFYVADYNTYYYLSLHSGLVEMDESEIVADIKVSSSALAFFFDFVWGGDTLNINGRYERVEGGDYSRVHELSNLVLMEESWNRDFIAYEEWGTRQHQTGYLKQTIPSLEEKNREYPYHLEF